MHFSTSILAINGLAASAWAHGYVSILSYKARITIFFPFETNRTSYVRSHIMNSKTYTGFLPVATPNFDASPPSIVRHINAHHPITNVSSPAIACNIDARPISDNGKSRVGTVTAGSDIEFHWGKGFPHAGPAITYMAL
jgi:hypothetical protein